MPETLTTNPNAAMPPESRLANAQPLQQLNETYPGLVEAIPDAHDQELFIDGVSGLPADMQDAYYKRMGHTMNEPDPVTATTGRRGILFELGRIKDLQSSGLETVDFEARKEIGDVTYMGYSKKADINGAPDKEFTSPVDCDVPISRGGVPHIYEVKSFPRMPYGSNAAKRNQLLKYQQAIDTGAVEGASVEIKGRVDPQFVEWARGSEKAPSPIASVEMLYTIDLPSGKEYTVVLKPGAAGTGLRFNNPEVTEDVDRTVVAGIEASEADGSLAALITAEDTSVAPDELRAAIDNPMAITSLDTFRQYEEVKRVAMYERFIQKGTVPAAMPQAA